MGIFFVQIVSLSMIPSRSIYVVMPLMADVGRLIVEKLRELDRHE